MITDLALLAVGDKGFHFTQDVLVAQAGRDFEVAFVVTYEQMTSSYAIEDFRDLCSSFGVSLVVDKRPDFGALAADLIFAVGWQYLVDPSPEGLIVFHDAVLPEFRGFAPTVSALMAGKDQLGVTAIRPSSSTDAGPIIAQEVVPIQHPIRVKDAFALIRPAYLELLIKICDEFRKTRALESTPQDESRATYSLWLDELDYLLDWSRSADELQRQVFAQSSPYDGSVAVTVRGDKFRVLDASVVEDVAFVNRTPGKTWAITDRGPVVVCGKGLLLIEIGPMITDGPLETLNLRTRFADIAHARALMA